MKIDVLENEKDRLVIEIHDDTTLVNLLHENVWNDKGFSTYTKKHPYLSNPVLTIKGSNPKKTLLNAAEQAVSDVKEMKKQVKNL